MKKDRFITPSVYMIGETTVDMEALHQYLIATGNEQFITTLEEAKAEGVADAEALISLYAKLCYKSLTVGQNENITRVRSIADNVKNCLEVAHGSVFEHVGVNFIVSDCSRVFTHELVRHRIGTAFSQTSGRYVRVKDIQLVWDPILAGCEEHFDEALVAIEKAVYLSECAKGLRKPPAVELGQPVPSPTDGLPGQIGDPNLLWVSSNEIPFTERKKITSAIRRIAPNGQSNEIGFSVNIRSLRHTILMRTSRFSEWEIRTVFAEIYLLAKAKFPLLFSDAKEELVDGIIEVSGMRMQPYEQTLETASSSDMIKILKERGDWAENPPTA